MAATVELLIRSMFSGEGVSDAVLALRQLSDKAADAIGPKLLGRNIFDLAEILPNLFDADQLRAQADALDEQAALFNQLAIAAANLQRTDLAVKYIREGQALKSYAATLRSAVPSIETITASQEKLNAAMSKQLFIEMQKQLQGTRRELRKVQQEALGISDKELVLGSLNAKSIKEVNDQLSVLAQRQRDAGTTALEMGDVLRADRFFETANAIENMGNAFHKTTGKASQFNLFGKEASIWMRIMRSQFNQLGFAMFVTQSTFRSLINVVKSFNAAIEEGSKRIQLFTAYAIATQKAQIESAHLAKELENVSKGLIDQETRLGSVIELINSGNPQIAKQADLFARASVTAAQMAGDISKANQIYKDWVEALIQGDASLISSSAHAIDLSDAYLQYAVSIGKAVDELDEQDKKLAVLQESVRIAKELAIEAENLGEAPRTLAETGSALKEMWDSVKSSVSFVIDLLLRGLEVADNSFISVILDTDAFKESIATIADIVWGTGIAIGASFKLGAAGIELAIDKADKLEEVLRRLGRYDFFGALKTGIDETETTIEELGDIVETEINSAIDAFNRLSGKFRLALGLMEDSNRKFQKSVEETFNITPFEDMISQLDFILSEERQMFLDLEDLWEDFDDRVIEIARRHGQRLEKLGEERNNRLIELAEERNDRIAEIDEDMLDRIEDIDNDAAKAQEKSKKKHDKKIEDLEEDHQRRLRDIMRRYELDRFQALIERDARALVEAQRRRDEALQKEEENFRDRQEQADDQHEEELNNIRERQEERRQDALEAWEKRRKDAIEQFEKQREETIEQYNEQRKEILEKLKQQEKDLRDSYEKRAEDIVKSFQRQRLKVIAQLTRQKIEEAQQLAESTGNWSTYTASLVSAMNSWLTFLIDAAELQGQLLVNPGEIFPGSTGGGTGGGTGGNDPCAFISRYNPPPNADVLPFPCSPAAFSPTCTAADGSQWRCIGGRWRRVFGSNQPQQTTSFVPSSNGVVPQSTGGTAQPSSPIPVQLVTNDQGLQAILDEVVADAFIRITS